MSLKFQEYQQYDGLGLAELVKQKQVHPAELFDLAISRAEQVNPKINAIVRRFDQRARRVAHQPINPDAPFAGVPFLVKDLLQEVAGEICSGGSRALKQHVAQQSSDMTLRLEQAGVVIFGMTNTPEFGSKGVTEPRAFGATRNPWQLGHTCGGSSGGSAAAVAAGIVPIAGANDGGGSIRIPAAACGLFGLKPSRGLVSVGGQISESFFGAVAQGVVSRSVRDSAAMLDVLQGAGRYAPYPVPASSGYLAQLYPPKRRLKIAFSVTSPVGLAVDAQVVQAVRDTAALLASLGHHVEEAAPQIAGRTMIQDFFLAWCCLQAQAMQDARRRTGASVTAFEPDTRAMAGVGETVSALELMNIQANWHAYTQTLCDFQQQYDVWLQPVCSAPPLKIGALDTPKPLSWLGDLAYFAKLSRVSRRTQIFEERVISNLAWTPFTPLANITGRPAMSVPMAWSQDGLPIGVQVIGRLHEDGLLLQLAAELEQARPWCGRVPVL